MRAKGASRWGPEKWVNPTKKKKKKEERSWTVLKGMITFHTLIHAHAPEGDLCSPSVCECTSACMSAHAYQIYFQGSSELYSFFLFHSFSFGNWQLVFFSPLSTCFSSRMSGINGKVRTETKNYDGINLQGYASVICFALKRKK